MATISDTPSEQVRRSGTTDRPLKYVDCDVHPYVKDGIASVLPYMSEAWRKHFLLKGYGQKSGHGSEAIPHTMRFAQPNGIAMRPDATPPGGGAPGSDPEFLKADLLDRVGIDYAVLCPLEPGAFAVALAGPDEAAALCSAYNDYFIAEWLPRDERFKLAICVPSQDPALAAEEVRRLGDHPSVVAVFMPLMNTLLGHRSYHPVYEEAQRQDLPVYVHLSGTEFIYQGGPTAPGWPQSYPERRIMFCQLAPANITSLIFSGTLERFPQLRFVFSEFGFSWALPLLWRMDSTWQATRLGTPWVKRFPSEYVRERIRFTTQPVDEPADPKHLNQLIEMLGSELLLFSTDYPHWDAEEPAQVLRTLPAEAKSQIFWRSAAEFFRLDERR